MYRNFMLFTNQIFEFMSFKSDNKINNDLFEKIVQNGGKKMGKNV